MNIIEYIESGILEQYVIGSLSPKEIEEVEQMIQQYPEVKEEVSKIELTLEKLSKSQGIKPGLSEDQLVKNIKGNSNIPDAHVNSVFSKIWPYISLLALVLSLGAYFWKTNTCNECEHKLEHVTKVMEVSDNNNKLLQEQIKILTSAKTEKIVLAGTKLSPDAYAAIIISEDNIYLSSQGLPDPAKEKQYQLWALKDGKPISMGVFDIKVDSLIEIQNVAGAQAYAITLEPKGGVESPTLDQMYVMGAVTE
jgi:hypothetical protein